MRAVSIGLALCVAVPAAAQQVMPSGSDEILLRNGQ